MSSHSRMRQGPLLGDGDVVELKSKKMGWSGLHNTNPWVEMNERNTGENYTWDKFDVYFVEWPGNEFDKHLSAYRYIRTVILIVMYVFIFIFAIAGNITVRDPAWPLASLAHF